MPDKRSHRGPHPDDDKLFGDAAIPNLRAAAADYVWLLNRGYASQSSLKLVGDRYRLARRQRVALARSLCSDEAVRRRADRMIDPDQLVGATLLLDGFNVLVTVEAALGGGVILCARDDSYRDMASMHGTYRKTAETRGALTMIGELAEQIGIAQCQWFFDSPVSNSGRLAEMTRELATQHDWPWHSQVVNDPDQVLSDADDVIATADSAVLDRGGTWFNLARHVIDNRIPDACVVDFADRGE